MSETDKAGGGLWLYERNERVVIEAFRRGEFDYLEGAQEVNEADFFRAIAQWQVLAKLAASYPTPREKQEVPLWVYLASDISMRFHGEHHYHALPYVLRVGGLVPAFGPAMGQKVRHPETGDATLHCAGFNDKNAYDRETPCDQDTVRNCAEGANQRCALMAAIAPRGANQRCALRRDPKVATANQSRTASADPVYD